MAVLKNRLFVFIKGIFHRAIYAKRIFSTRQINRCFTSKLENQCVATMYKGSENQKTPNARFKHCCHHKMRKHNGFSLTESPILKGSHGG